MEGNDEKFTRPCMKCRKPFEPEDRRRHWYCDDCRKSVHKQSNIREVSSRVQLDPPDLYDD
jgi:PHP family Zn ribbon phosphoesterase